MKIKTTDSHGILKTPRKMGLLVTWNALLHTPPPASQHAVCASHSRRDVLGPFHSPHHLPSFLDWGREAVCCLLLGW